MADHTRTRPSRPLLFVLAVGFALAHTQSPLFFSNQNQYLLHGLADAGYGHLSHDWLANTQDPTPVFSAGVALAYKIGGLFAIQAAFFALLMAYFFAMWRLVEALGSPRLVPFAALFTAAHAAIFRLASVWLTGVDYPWYFQAGVAGQYVLGPGIQPSAFGVLLAMSLAAFARGRPHLAAALAAGSTIVHATYLLPAALLALGYATALLRDGRTRTALSVSAVSLAIATPMIAYVLVAFPPTTPQVDGSARSVLATVRIPHHAQVARWLDLVAILQIAWIALGLVLLRRTRLFVPLAVAAGGSIFLTALQAVSGNDALALLFPWRISVILVPVATAAVAVRIVPRIARSPNPPTPVPEREGGGSPSPVRGGVGEGFFGALLAVQAAAGIAVMALGLGYRMNEAEQPLLDYVREHASPADVYLIPTRIPPVGSGAKGSVSTSFTPPPRPKPGSNLIPVDLQRFRLATGAAIHGDFKSVPYASREVLEWLRRVKQVEAWYSETDWDAAGIREQFLKEGITRVVVPRASPDAPPLRAAGFALVHQDDAHAVYAVK